MNSSLEENELMEKSEFQENLSLLREIFFFSQFPIEILKVFAYQCTREAYRDGDIIFNQNEDDGRAYYILSGHAYLSRNYEDKEVVIRTCGENVFLGAFTLTGKVKRLFSLTSSTDTYCLVLTRDDFQDIVSQFQDSRQYILKGLTDLVLSWERLFLSESINCNLCRGIMGVSLL